MASMKRIHISGKMTITFIQHIDVPDDEVEDFISDEGNITCNINLNLASWEVEEWDSITTRITDVPKGYL